MMKTIRNFMAILLGGSILLTCLMILVFMLPTNSMRNHVHKSIGIELREQNYQSLMGNEGSHLDGFTDSIMLHNAIYSGPQSAVQKAMLVYRGQYDKNSLNDEKIKEIPHPTLDLIAAASGYHTDTTISYSRYWHGYLLYLKPLLLAFTYGQLRQLNMLTQICLTGLLFYLLYKRNLGIYIPALIVSLCLLTPVVLPLSLQFSAIFYIMTLSMLAVLKWNITLENKNKIYLFLLTGMATSFFDFLTYPVAALGMPLILMLNSSKLQNFKQTIKSIISCCISWTIGYGGLWAMKWIIASLLTKENVILNGIQTVLYRTSTTTSASEVIHNISLLTVLGKNFAAPGRIYWIFFLIFTIFIIWKIHKTHVWKKVHFDRTLFIYLFPMILPLAWYIVVSNHSFVHAWFTSRALIVFAFALLSLLTRLYEYLKNKEKSE